ncbi:MAG: hypothetical protein WD708_06740 [Kiritimatiellia bacterium]
MNNYLRILVLGLGLAFIPAFAQFDGKKSDFEQAIELLEIQQKRWETRAREAEILEDRTQFQQLATNFEQLRDLRMKVESAWGSKRKSLQEDLDKLRKITVDLESEANKKFIPTNPFPDMPPVFPTAPEAIPTPVPPSSYTTESGFEIKLRLVD